MGEWSGAEKTTALHVLAAHPQPNEELRDLLEADLDARALADVPADALARVNPWRATRRLSANPEIREHHVAIITRLNHNRTDASVMDVADADKATNPAMWNADEMAIYHIIRDIQLKEVNARAQKAREREAAADRRQTASTEVDVSAVLGTIRDLEARGQFDKALAVARKANADAPNNPQIAGEVERLKRKAGPEKR